MNINLKKKIIISTKKILSIFFVLVLLGSPTKAFAAFTIDIKGTQYQPEFVLAIQESTKNKIKLSTGSKVSDPKLWEASGVEATLEELMITDQIDLAQKSFLDKKFKSLEFLSGSIIKMIEAENENNFLDGNDNITLLLKTKDNKHILTIDAENTDIDKNDTDLDIEPSAIGGKDFSIFKSPVYDDEEKYPFIYYLDVNLKLNIILEDDTKIDATLKIDKTGFSYSDSEGNANENANKEETKITDPNRGKTVEDIKISYTGGKNNINRFLPQEFRNETFKDEAKLKLPGASIKIMTPENEQFIKNTEQTIKIIEYLKSSIGLKEVIKQKDDFLSLKLFDDSSDSLTVKDVLTNNEYVSPVVTPENMTADDLENALFDLKEHIPEGAVDNFIFNFIRFNLLIIQVMSIFFLIYGGYLWVTSQGEEGQLEKGKNIILWAVISMIGAAICYVIISIVTQMFTN